MSDEPQPEQAPAGASGAQYRHEGTSAAPASPLLTRSSPAPAEWAFRWACLAVVSLTLGYLCWAVEDLRREAKASGQAVNAHLPQILEKVEHSSAILKEVSDDLKTLRDLAGASGPRDKSLAVFADRLLDQLEAAPVQVGVEKLIGTALKNPLPAADWVRDARKEALWLTFRAKSKGELLERLCKNKFGSEWLVQEGAAAPEPLRAWFAARDEEARALRPGPK